MNKLFLGDNLQILRNHVNDKCIDLIYLDPPFNSNANYDYVSTDSNGQSKTVTAFVDTWQWTDNTELELEQIRGADKALFELLSLFAKSMNRSALSAYLIMMGIRLLELKRVLKPSGSIYLHCDASASSYLKVILDYIFGHDWFRSEIAWKRTSSHNDSKKWAHIHDTLLFYAGKGFTWNPVYLSHDPEYIKNFYRYEDERGQYRLHEIIRTASMGARPNLAYCYKNFTPEWGWRQVKQKVEALDKEGRLTWSGTGRPYLKRYLHEQKGTPCPSLWLDIPPLSHAASERMGYPTQKPLTLLERIILASSNQGDVILDPFAGCGTSTHAAQKLARSWVAIDISALAVKLMQKRLKQAFQNVDYSMLKSVATPVRGTKTSTKKSPDKGRKSLA